MFMSFDYLNDRNRAKIKERENEIKVLKMELELRKITYEGLQKMQETNNKIVNGL